MIDRFFRAKAQPDTQRGSGRAPGGPKRWPWADSRGSMAVVTAFSAIPILAAVGVGIDITRMVQAKETLRSATDAAALAGATLYTTAGQGPTAKTTAQAYFDKYSNSGIINIPKASVTVNIVYTPSPDGLAPNKVTVTATGTIPTTMMQLVGFPTMSMTSVSVAGIQTPQPQPPRPLITAAPGTGSASQLLGNAPGVISAGDWNAAYMYPVPLSGGSPDYSMASVPLVSTMYEIGSTCGSINTSWIKPPGVAWCNGKPGAIPPQNVNFAYDNSNQPLAFLFIDMNNGADAAPNGNGYGPNQYGTKPGAYHVMATAPLSQALPNGPSSISDDTVNILKRLNPLVFGSLSQGATTFTSQKNNLNCAVQIEDVTSKTTLPTLPPSRRPENSVAANGNGQRCFVIGNAVDDQLSGRALANLSCNQIGGRTLMYWWNDMGAGSDDYDYKNLIFLLSCQPGVTNPDNGTFGTTVPPIPTPPPTARLLQQ